MESVCREKRTQDGFANVSTRERRVTRRFLGETPDPPQESVLGTPSGIPRRESLDLLLSFQQTKGDELWKPSQGKSIQEDEGPETAR